MNRLERAALTVFRSWWTLIAFLLFTVAWWAGFDYHDPWPWVGWTTITTLLTQLDTQIVGIGQKKQQKRDEELLAAHDQMLRNQAHTMTALLVLMRQIRETQLEEHDEDE